MAEIYWEDLAVGQVHELGSVQVDEAEMLAFARSYDPQPIHTDAVAAAAGPFGGMIASGWLTCGLWMRLYVQTLLGRADSRGSGGVEEVRWLAPVYAGDVLTGSMEVIEHRPSSKHPDRGTIRLQGELRRPDGQVVMTLRSYGLYGRRTPAA